jgi:hypothetical protein
MSKPISDTGDFAEVPVGQRADLDGYDPDDYGGVPVFGDDAELEGR